MKLILNLAGALFFSLSASAGNLQGKNVSCAEVISYPDKEVVLGVINKAAFVKACVPDGGSQENPQCTDSSLVNLRSEILLFKESGDGFDLILSVGPAVSKKDFKKTEFNEIRGYASVITGYGHGQVSQGYSQNNFVAIYDPAAGTRDAAIGSEMGLGGIMDLGNLGVIGRKFSFTFNLNSQQSALFPGATSGQVRCEIQ